MNTITINITLPKPMKQAVDIQIKNGLYTSFSEFIRNAVRHLLSSHENYYTGPFSSEAEKEILTAEKGALKNRSKNIVLNNPQEIKKFFKNL